MGAAKIILCWTFAALVVLSTPLTWAADEAHAALPPAVAADLAQTPTSSQIYQWIERGGLPSGRAPVPHSGTVASNLWLQEHRSLPGQPSSDAMYRSLRREAWKARSKARLMPTWRALGKVGLAATAFTAGFSIGTAARKLFTEESVPAAAGAITGLQTVDLDEGCPNTGGSMPFLDLSPWGGLMYTCAEAPAEGWVATRNESGSPYLVTHAPTHDPADGDGYTMGPVPLTPPVPSLGWVFSETGPYAHGGPVAAAGAFKYRDALPPREQEAGDDVDVTIVWPGAGEGTNGETTDTTRDRLRDELANNPASYPTLTPWLDYHLGGGSADPTAAPTSTVPSCAGLLYAACANALTQLNLVPSRTTLTFAQADLDKPADAVVNVPAQGNTVEHGTPVEVISNPAPANMPVKIPAPLPAGETYADYATRLGQLGLVATRLNLSEATMSAEVGPGEVASSSPATGSRVASGSSVTVRVNPETAPQPTGPGGLFTPPSIPALDFSPLMAAGVCANFPFGVPCWVHDIVAEFVGSPSTPSWDFHFPMAGEGSNMHVDLALFEPHMATVRSIIGVLISASMVWLFYGLAFGGAIGGGRDEGSK